MIGLGLKGLLYLIKPGLVLAQLRNQLIFVSLKAANDLASGVVLVKRMGQLLAGVL